MDIGKVNLQSMIRSLKVMHGGTQLNVPLKEFAEGLLQGIVTARDNVT